MAAVSVGPDCAVLKLFFSFSNKHNGKWVLHMFDCFYDSASTHLTRMQLSPALWGRELLASPVNVVCFFRVLRLE